MRIYSKITIAIIMFWLAFGLATVFYPQKEEQEVYKIYFIPFTDEAKDDVYNVYKEAYPFEAAICLYGFDNLITRAVEGNQEGSLLKKYSQVTFSCTITDDFMGFMHSHPLGLCLPSPGDSEALYKSDYHHGIVCGAEEPKEVFFYGKI